MTVKRFFGESAREALRKVKAALGPEAIVISNKPVDGGVEIMAMSADSLEALSQPGGSPAPATAKPVAPPPAASRAVSRAPTFSEDDDYAVSLSAKARAPSPFQPWQPPRVDQPATPAKAAAERPRPRPLPPKDKPEPRRDSFGASFDPAAFGPGAAEPGMIRSLDDSPQVQHLVAEMASIKSLLERQLAGFAWNDLTRHAPAKAQLLGEMLDAGFSGVLARRLAEDLPDDLELQEGRKWLLSAVNRRLRTLTKENDLVERGGVFALVGPTGVGKTTTTAKLAARCVVRYGAEKLALLTTDGYRIGAHEQLRIYGRILGSTPSA